MTQDKCIGSPTKRYDPAGAAVKTSDDIKKTNIHLGNFKQATTSLAQETFNNKGNSAMNDPDELKKRRQDLTKAHYNLGEGGHTYESENKSHFKGSKGEINVVDPHKVQMLRSHNFHMGNDKVN